MKKGILFTLLLIVLTLVACNNETPPLPPQNGGVENGTVGYVMAKTSERILVITSAFESEASNRAAWLSLSEDRNITLEEIKVGQRVQWHQAPDTACAESYPEQCMAGSVAVLEPTVETDAEVKEAKAIQLAIQSAQSEHGQEDENWRLHEVTLEENKWVITLVLLLDEQKQYEIELDARTGNVLNVAK